MEISYEEVYALPEVSYLGGTDYTLYFTIADENGSPGNVSGATVIWYLSDFEQRDFAQLSYPAEIVNADEVKVSIPASDTLYLEGKFLQQLKISDATAQYRPLQGVVIIAPAIP